MQQNWLLTQRSLQSPGTPPEAHWRRSRVLAQVEQVRPVNERGLMNVPVFCSARRVDPSGADNLGAGLGLLFLRESCNSYSIGTLGRGTGLTPRTTLCPGKALRTAIAGPFTWAHSNRSNWPSDLTTDWRSPRLGGLLRLLPMQPTPKVLTPACLPGAAGLFVSTGGFQRITPRRTDAKVLKQKASFARVQ
jgi:hypothetical protein